MIDVWWADPPAPQGGKLTRKEQREFADQLRNRREQWAVYPTSGSSVAIRALTSRISRGVQGAFGEGFEAVSRNGVVYVRFVGVADRNTEAPSGHDSGCINRDPKHLETYTAAECAAHTAAPTKKGAKAKWQHLN
jgi:hypothetical protein